MNQFGNTIYECIISMRLSRLRFHAENVVDIAARENSSEVPYGAQGHDREG